ncbi:MAG: hypothetical protein KDD40_07150, partial [Bdellovibrionales bacterium]|nr:hypothetical protein [Bdellovibrionales bacterium]
KAYVDHFYFGDFHLSDIKFNSFLKGGIVNLKGQVDKAYGGQILMDSLKFSAVDPAPETLVAVQTKNINVDEAFKHLITGYENQVQGQLDLLFRGKVPYPQGRDWSEKIFAKGNFVVKNGEFKTFKFDALASDVLAESQGIGTNEASKVIGRGYMASGKYSMAKNRILLSEVKVYTPDNNQLDCNGYVDVNLNCNLSGTVYLAKAPVRKSVIAANRDNKGRFFAPLSIKGNLLSPGVSFARETLDQLLSNAIRYEAHRTQERSRKALEEQAKKNQQKLDSKT